MSINVLLLLCDQGK